MLEFPNIEIEKNNGNKEDALKRSLGQFSVCDFDFVEEKEGKHIFSHIEWQLKAVKIRIKQKPEDKKLVFIKKSEIEDYAIPTAFKLGKELLDK